VLSSTPAPANLPPSQLLPCEVRFPTPIFATISGNAEAALLRQMQDALRAAGLFVDDLTARYFQGIHRYFPIVSRPRFHSHLASLGTAPLADFTCLLVAMCLISSCPALERRAKHAVPPPRSDQGTLYLTARSVYSQVQALVSPSLFLIQAGILLALYEYVCENPGRAFATIADCARMGYAACIHCCHKSGAESPSTTIGGLSDLSPYDMQAQEAANTWWGLVTCERIVFCDIGLTTQPLVTLVPDSYKLLPIDSTVLGQINLNAIGVELETPSPDEGSFDRTVQAAILLEQVAKVFKVTNVNARLVELQDLDSTIQAFLVALMQQAEAARKSCQAVTISIRYSPFSTTLFFFFFFFFFFSFFLFFFFFL